MSECDDIELSIELKLTGDLARRVVAKARQRGQRPVEMMADAVIAMVASDLIDAVIDDGASG